MGIFIDNEIILSTNSSDTEKILVAMSGGVDSAVAAALLKDEGHNLIGVTMKTWGYDDIPEKDSGCCSLGALVCASPSLRYRC